MHFLSPFDPTLWSLEPSESPTNVVLRSCKNGVLSGFCHTRLHPNFQRPYWIISHRQSGSVARSLGYIPNWGPLTDDLVRCFGADAQHEAQVWTAWWRSWLCKQGAEAGSWFLSVDEACWSCYGTPVVYPVPPPILHQFCTAMKHRVACFSPTADSAFTILPVSSIPVVCPISSHERLRLAKLACSVPPIPS